MDERAETIGELYLENRELKQTVVALRERLKAEERTATISGGTLSDVCDLVFGDPERAGVHGYKGVKEEIIDLKNRALMSEFFQEQAKEAGRYYWSVKNADGAARRAVIRIREETKPPADKERWLEWAEEIFVEELRSRSSLVVPNDWHMHHKKECGTKYRGCAPDCPKDVYEKTGIWTGPPREEADQLREAFGLAKDGYQPPIESHFTVAEGKNSVCGAHRITCKTCGAYYVSIFSPDTMSTKEWMEKHVKSHAKAEADEKSDGQKPDKV